MNIFRKWLNGDYYLITLAFVALIGSLSFAYVLIMDIIRSILK